MLIDSERTKFEQIVLVSAHQFVIKWMFTNLVMLFFIPV